MRPLLSLSFFMLAVSACNPFAGSGDVVTNPAQLTESSFYNIDSVRAVASAGNEEAARKKFMTASRAPSIQNPGDRLSKSLSH